MCKKEKRKEGQKVVMFQREKERRRQGRKEREREKA